MIETVIEWTGKAFKQLKRIPEPQRVYQAVQDLKLWPDCRNTKKLKDRDEYRLRVGNYRVIFTVIGRTPRIIRIEEVKKRDERTY
jgi:mRNA-degrading endonuclease RelE of RelBE toxin-antitoxin system